MPSPAGPVSRGDGVERANNSLNQSGADTERLADLQHAHAVLVEAQDALLKLGPRKSFEASRFAVELSNRQQICKRLSRSENRTLHPTRIVPRPNEGRDGALAYPLEEFDHFFGSLVGTALRHNKSIMHRKRRVAVVIYGT
jgi:hypothetical protein